ncbi:DNA-processing protein DprA [Pandoraea pneumonica]
MVKTGYRRIAIGAHANSQSSDGETRRDTRAAGFASLGPPVNAYRMMKNFSTAPLSPLTGGTALSVPDGLRHDISAAANGVKPIDRSDAAHACIDSSQVGATAEDIKAWLRLCAAPRVPRAAVRRLLKAFGLPEVIFRTDPAQLAEVLPRDVVACLLTRPSPELADLIARTLDWAAQPGCTVLTLADTAYPRALLDLGDAPPMLYCRGDIDLPNRIGAASVAIVGSRLASPQGRENARHFARRLGEAGVTVVSGLAAGIDAAAHDGALNTPGGTCAVVGTGPDLVYPSRNRSLAERIGCAANGLVMSAFPVGTPPRPSHFPQRNRLIAALARGTLVVEAATKSGSLITARLAGELGRDVLAVPGSIHAQQSTGCHALIRDGATLVTSPEDVLEALGLTGKRVPTAEDVSTNTPGNVATSSPEGGLSKVTAARLAGRPTVSRDKRSSPASLPTTGLSPPAAAILEALGYDPSSADTLRVRTGLNIVTVLQHLSVLELDGWIARAPGACFVRLTREV